MPYKSQWKPGLRAPLFINGFEDLAFLFTNSHENRGIIRMDFEEAAFLWTCVIGMPPGTHVVEVGRAEGGSTILLAAAAKRKPPLIALPDGVIVYSIDNDPVNDARLQDVLAGLRFERVDLIVGDSQTYDTSGIDNIGLLFIDGDHTYPGVKADFENWLPTVVPGGTIAFHDVTTSGLENYGPEQLYHELLEDPRVSAIGGAGSMRALIKARQ